MCSKVDAVACLLFRQLHVLSCSVFVPFSLTRVRSISTDVADISSSFMPHDTNNIDNVSCGQRLVFAFLLFFSRKRYGVMLRVL
jgi:hypothetical protein